MKDKMQGKKIMMPELAIFDMDGLMFDTENLTMNMKTIVLNEYGYVNRKEDYIKTLGLGGDKLIAMLKATYGDDYPAEEINAKLKALTNEYIEKNGPDVKPGIENLLKFLNDNGVRCCVASSTHSPYINRNIRLAGFEKYFDFIIGGESVTRSKPDPDIFNLACKTGNVDPSKAIVLEDSENGILAAYNAGIPCICIPDMKYPADDIADKAAVILTAADELIDLL